MKKASVSEAKNSLSALLDKVKAGASIVIQDRGRPVARLEPIASTGAAGDRLEQLIRDGVVRPARGPIPRKLLSSGRHQCAAASARSRHCSRNAAKDGEVLGLVGDCAVARSPDRNRARSRHCDGRSGNAGVVGDAGRVRVSAGATRARRHARRARRTCGVRSSAAIRRGLA